MSPNMEWNLNPIQNAVDYLYNAVWLLYPWAHIATSDIIALTGFEPE